MASIDVRNICYTYRDHGKEYRALNNINFTVADGQFTCIVGRSGCGKSTLLTLLAGLHLPDSGQILIDGVPIMGPNIQRTLVSPGYSLFPWMTVQHNVQFAVTHSHLGISRSQAGTLAEARLKQVGLSEHTEKYPYQLSSGMYQRLAIARAFAMDSDILLLDEPFSALDPPRRTELHQLLETLWQANGHRKTVLFVTHDIEEAMLADRILLLQPNGIGGEMTVSMQRPRSTQQNSPQFREVKQELLALFNHGDKEDCYESQR